MVAAILPFTKTALMPAAAAARLERGPLGDRSWVEEDQIRKVSDCDAARSVLQLERLRGQAVILRTASSSGKSLRSRT